MNRVFVDQLDMNAGSMGIVASNHVSIKQPTKIVFHINVAALINLCQPPPNYAGKLVKPFAITTTCRSFSLKSPAPHTTTFGIRYFNLDVDKGFSLNGKSFKICH